MRRSESAVPMPWPPPPPHGHPVQEGPTVKHRRPAPPVDRSHSGSCLRYSSFVAAGVLVTSATLLAAPALLLQQVAVLKQRYFSLDEDLQRSRDPSVHPCDDLYQHVCGGWDASLRGRYWSPLDKYQAVFEDHTIKQLLLRPIPARSIKARDKASAMLLKCLGRTGRTNTWTLRKLLLELGLPWPMKSTASRAELLDTLVKSSLYFGIHVFWAFYIGPHPLRPYESTIYSTLDERCINWIRDFELIIERGRHHEYLRRCAEIVGGTGQSYSTMIHDVTVTHQRIVKQVHLLWDPYAVPAFLKLSDPELRRALNGHLPDDSQLWPGDEIVSMQPKLFAELNATHLTNENFTERFKLFLGAYVVWVLTPFISRYLTTSMLADIGWANLERSHRYDKCLQALELVMPLVKWKIEHDTQGDRMNTWRMLRLSVLAFNDLHRIYGPAFRSLFSAVMEHVSTNAHNMTMTWSMLDKVYAYVQIDNSAGFFDAFLKALSRGVHVLKMLMRKPEPTILHAPGISGIYEYRILVAREVIVPNFLTTPPLFNARHPLAVHAAVAGTVICRQIIILARFVFFYGENFSHDPTNPIYRELRSLVTDLERYEAMVNASGFLPDQTLRETRHLMVAGWAVRLASSIAGLSEETKAAGTQTKLAPERQSYRGIAVDQLFFLISCFTDCGATGRTKEVQRAICNAAVPSVEAFRRSFQCRPNHRLVTNFTWPQAASATNASAPLESHAGVL